MSKRKSEKSVLVVAAHPDDEVLGCGGVIADYINKGIDVSVLILGEGVTSRFEKIKTIQKVEAALRKMKESISIAARALGIRKITALNFPDNKFDTVALLDIIKAVEKIKNEIKPSIVFTHHRNDLNIDHRITYNAVLTACRPLLRETVKEIYSFEAASSTEWNYPCTFNPNFFIDITDTIDKKIKSLNAYKTELRTYPHPRSVESVRNNAKRWGSIAGLDYAEAFEVVRIIK